MAKGPIGWCSIPVRMILLSSRVGKEAGLTGGDKRPARPVGFNLPGQVSIKKLEIGSLAAAGILPSFSIIPQLRRSRTYLGRSTALSAFHFSYAYRTSIDYQAKELTFTPDGYKPTDAAAGDHDHADRI